MGRIMGSHPEFRSDPGAVMKALMAAGAEVNAMGLDAQRAALEEEAPELLEAKKQERRDGLKPLPGADDVDKVVLRFAPNPNGPLSLGHGRGVAIMSEYAKQYEADLILRFDDTDPQVKPPLYNDDIDGYAWIEEDFQWLGGVAPARIVKASDRIPVYYEHALQLIAKDGAYVCDCDPESWREMKNQGQPCPCRNHGSEQTASRFLRMTGALPNMGPEGALFEAGQAVLRVKTDIQHKDPALRDWAAFRIVPDSAVHPRAAKGEIPSYRCWPLLDFESAVEDHLQGVTHIIRGKDLMDSTRKQQFLYQHMGWDYPQTMYWGRVSVHEFGKFSTSMMRQGIEEGTFSGWDDIRLPTLRALRRRGFDGQALHKFWVGLGVSEKDIAISMENVEAEDGKAQDERSPRYFFVPDPVVLRVEGIEGKHAKPLLHPGDPSKGTRTITATAEVVVPGAELADAIRLKDLGNVRKDGDRYVWAGEELDRSMPILQWLPAESPRLSVHKPVGTTMETIEGQVEAAALQANVAQFERFGFVRIEGDHAIWLHG